MRVFLAAILLMTGCASAPQPERNPANEYYANLKEQLGIDRAEQRQALCTKLPSPKVGMSANDVLASCWGKPDHAAESVTARGKDEIWSYPDGYVYLSGGFVTKIVTAR